MQQALMLALLICDLTLASENSHLRELKEEFPYGLLTDDYGILNKTDLKTNACMANPGLFTDPPTNHSYSYWQCFAVDSARMTCERGKYDPQEKALMSMLVISGVRDREAHEFISRRPIPLETCGLFMKDWRKLTKGENYVCVSGSEPLRDSARPKVTWNWLFGRYKTEKGCDSYFQEECSPSACDPI